MHKKRAAVAAVALITLSACLPWAVTAEPKDAPSPVNPAAQVLFTKSAMENLRNELNEPPEFTIRVNTTSASSAPTPEPQKPWADYELNAIAQTLAGECYDDKAEDKRLVCEVILNRVASPEFPSTILEVLTAENAFSGYWHQSREITDNDRKVAEAALKDWYANDCHELSGWLYFSAGANRENEFRTTY